MSIRMGRLGIGMVPILLIGAILSAFVVRLPSLRSHPGSAEVLRGDWDYYGIGLQLAREGLFRPFPGGELTAFRMPFYP